MPLAVRRRSQAPDDTAPDGSEIRLLAGAAEGATRSSVCEALLPAGQLSRPLRHRTVEEVWYILEGHGRVWRCPPDAPPGGVAPQPVAPGDTLVIPAGWSFQFAAPPDGPLRFLCLTVPPWPGEGETLPVPHGPLGPASL
jgi:mannose-6-phosphate isomerase-like protein (cupin superfamily)